MTGERTAIRVPNIRALTALASVLVAIGLSVFLRRYRGADRTAMAFGLTVGAGTCLMVALLWFQRRFAGTIMTRRALRRLGTKSGAVAGGCTIGVAIGLLALRWGIDQAAGPAGDQFGPAFVRAFSALAVQMAWGIPLYLAVGAAVGALLGLGLAELIGSAAPGVPDPDRPEEG